MNKYIYWNLIVFCTLLVSSAVGQEKDITNEWQQVMNLLPGYRVVFLQGIDSAEGRIWKPGGVSIGISLLGNASNYADSDDVRSTTIWRKEQAINGLKVICVYTKSKQLVVTFPPNANFVARIRKPEDLADMLLMVLTYHSPFLPVPQDKR